jgi:hypothetical protein
MMVVVAASFSVAACAGSPGVGRMAQGLFTKPAPPDPSTPEGKKLQEGCATCKARYHQGQISESQFSTCTFEEADDHFGYCKL